MKVDKSFELSMMSPLKITMMLLVVLYHSCVMWAGEGWFDKPAVQCVQLGMLASWLNTFHVAAFVFASGYLYSYLRRETGHYGTIVSVLTKKAKRLLLPYAAISVLWAAPIYALFFGSDDLIWKFAFAASPSQLWFLPMLYWCFVILELVRVLFPGLVERPLKLLLYAVGISLVAPIVSALVGNILQLTSAFQYLPVFLCRLCFQGWRNKAFLVKGPRFLDYHRFGSICCLVECRMCRGPRSVYHFKYYPFAASAGGMCHGAFCFRHIGPFHQERL